MPKVIIVGCGFLGGSAADLFSSHGWSVLGLCATQESAASFVGKPYEVRAQDISQEFTIEPKWHGADALIHCASSGRGGAEAYRAVYQEGLLNAMSAVQPRRTIFVSSTSVYGQTDGSWVNESSETKPERETSRILLDAEGIALVSGGYAARLSGLYGPGRAVLRQKFLNGEAVLEGPGGRWINQIHRDDAALALWQIFAARAEPGIYNVTDDTPVSQREVYGWMAEYFGKPLPPTGEPNLDRKRAWTNKRVSNAKLRALGWAPRFPSYRDALPSLA